MDSRYIVVFITVDSQENAQKIANKLLTERKAACVNIISKVESHYWWQGKLESSPEVLLVMKTTTTRLTALEDLVVAQHPYDTPEFIVLPINRGNKRYLTWLENSVA